MLKQVLAGLSSALLLISGAMPYSNASSPDNDTGAIEYDVVIYGGNASGIIAAIQVAKMNKTVAVVDPNPYRIGGLTTGGLGDTDVGSSGTIGGLAREFYQRVGKKYGKNEQYKFEAKVALDVLTEWVAEYDNIHIFADERLDLSNGVTKDGTAIRSITTESGKVFRGKMFLDCTYEGDLMAKADVTYTTGRESNDTYGETLNGITSASDMDGLPAGIDPYVIKGTPSSGLLPRVNQDAGGESGAMDKRIQAYNFRWTLTSDPNNRRNIEKPDNYNEEDYELLFRAIELGLKADKIFKTSAANALPNNKMDANNNCGISTDFIGMNYAYPEGDYATREKIIKEHETYQRGLLWTLQNHPRVPEAMREYFSKWGLCADEFTENDNWSTQLYVRESRRMISDFVMTQQVCKVNSTVYVGDSIGMGSYHMDSHHIQYIVKNGQVVPEGGFYTPAGTYPISYRSIVPKANECTNLLVPVCLSASHAAYGSIRMEPVFMLIGQAAATAAVIAIDDGVTTQDVNYNKLAARLKSDSQILYTGGSDLPPVIDETAIVYPIEEVPVTTGPDGLEYGYYDTAYALSSTKYNRVFTSKTGDYIEFEVDVDKPGTYSVSAQSNLQDARGKYRLYLPDGDRYLGDEKDQYGYYVADTPDRIRTDTFGTVTVNTPGKLRLRFVVTGKNEKSKGYTLAFCNIILGSSTSGAVRFDSNGGSLVAGQGLVVGQDQLVIQPADPIRAGYRLEGWYKDQALTQKWNFAADTVNDDTTLYAKWSPEAPEAYTVAFQSNYGDGGSSVGSQHIAADSDRLISRPDDPVREGYAFDGWYTSVSYDTKWDFKVDTVSADTVLYAKWQGKTPDRSVLIKAIADAQIKLEDGNTYTAETLAVLMEKLAAAKAVGTDADEETIAKAAAELNAAIESLEKAAIPCIVYGNVDCDALGTVNAADALLTLQAATGKIKLADAQKMAADVDNSGDITASDALLILQYATKRITSFPVEKTV